MDKLRAFIADSGFTQRHWAREFDIGDAYLSQLLNGTRRPSIKLMQRISEKTGQAVMPNDWLEAA